MSLKKTKKNLLISPGMSRCAMNKVEIENRILPPGGDAADIISIWS